MFLWKNSKRLSMLNKSIKILGVRIDIFTIEEINNLIINKASEKFNKSTVIFKPYVEFLSLASKNSDIKKLLNSSDINIADSVAIQWSASYLYGAPKTHPNFLSAYYSLLFRMKSKKWRTQIVPERMAGLDQTLPLLKLANSKNLKIGIIGGPKDIESTKKEISKRFKNLSVHIWSGYFSESSEEEIVKDIAKKNLDILFCAMGFPRQEKFIINHRNELRSKVIIGEGGSFDYDQLGGGIKRAPVWMRKAGLEWLWRLMLQPKRIRRQLAIPSFISKITKAKKSTK